ncbi:hypothetical protein DPMN_017515 [Dreissena polymorpha]|uniref:Uncharacterized protein n=1 Tax=Dreissena polymorpha TaxID=45954 RepID=A0A9D4S7I5_DREPO|nr:hypothetical protein DPMN_017515 [Dreissena polymorpha]
MPVVLKNFKDKFLANQAEIVYPESSRVDNRQRKNSSNKLQRRQRSKHESVHPRGKASNHRIQGNCQF